VGEFIESLPPSEEIKKENLGKIARLLEKNGIDLDEVGKVRRLSVYQSLTKNEDGEAEIHDLFGVQIDPKWAEGPQWPVIDRGAPVRLPTAKASQTRSERPCAVVLPDIQFGYFRRSEGDLEAIHDESALSTALAITKAAKPTKVVLLGDNLDLCEFGKYRTTPAFQRSSQATIDRATLFLAELRRAAPDAEIVWIAGNHDERLSLSILDNAVAAYGLRQGNTPASWPVLSVPHLCRMDEFDVTYLSGYPASRYWITPELEAIHGTKVASNGSTAHKYLSSGLTHSVIYGHIHRIEYAERTIDTFDGARRIVATSPGCLARTDGAVPSTKGATDLDGRPLPVVENWQTGMCVIPYDDSGEFTVEMIPISNGVAHWRGKRYEGQGQRQTG